jgi:magnesium-transporting ATPase (P-type)
MKLDKKDLNNASSGKRLDIIGFLMVIIPLISSLLMWYWFYNYNHVNNMRFFLVTIIISTVFLTTILATIDSHRLGLKVKIYKRKEIYGGSFLKFFIFLLLWFYAYPVYLFRRKNYGGRNLLYPLIFSLLVFTGSVFYLWYAVEIRHIENEAYQRRVLRNKR